MAASPLFFKIEVGDVVRSSGRSYQVSHVLSVDSVLAVDLDSNESTRLRLETISPADNDEQTEKSARPALEQFSANDWEIAQKRLAIIKPFMEMPTRTRADAVAMAGKHGVHVATFYRWVRLFEASGQASSLVPEKRGRKAGTRLLNELQEKIIKTAIEDKYLTNERGTAQDVVDEAQSMCRLAKLPEPNHNTIRSRIRDIPAATAHRRRGRRDLARNRHEPIQGVFPGGATPLEVVQIDHTLADIVLVDEHLRKPIGRPWLTLALDVCTRMVTGLYVGFEPPSYMSVGMCIASTICPKSEYLASLGVTGEWPVWGKPGKLHADNAREFRGIKLTRACEEYSIDLQWRPVKKPHYGGHIERLMGTMASEIRKIPGKTFSNTHQRQGYDSEGKAIMTLREFEAYLVDFIVNKYHVRKHSELDKPPLACWKFGILGDATTPGAGTLPLPADPNRIRLDFLPYKQRTVQPYGIEVNVIHYYDVVLDPYIGSIDEATGGKRKFLFRYDPRDMSSLLFLDPADNRYMPIPYRDLSHPPVSEWEIRRARAMLKAEGVKDVDEARLFEASGRLRARIEDAKAATKAARRAEARMAKKRPSKPKVERQVPLPDTSSNSPLTNFAQAVIEEPGVDRDLFSETVEAFDVALSR